MDALVWTQEFDEHTPCHATAFSCALRCGMVSGSQHARRRDEDSRGFVVSWILTGTGMLHAQGHSHPIHDGCVVLRKPEDQSLMTLEPNLRHRRCYVRVDESLYPLLCRLVPELETPLPPVCLRPYDETMILRFQSFFEAMYASDERSPLSFLPDLRDLLCGLLDLRGGTADVRILEAASLLISLPPSTPLPEIARRCLIPYGQFRKRFMQVYGAAPGQWRIGQRVERAKQALSCGEPIAQVSSKLDYADVYTFTHQFRDVTGFTPKAYQLSHID